MLIETSPLFETFPHAGQGVNRFARVAPDCIVALDEEDTVRMFKHLGKSDSRSSRRQVA